jgi:hypothetical protein
MKKTYYEVNFKTGEMIESDCWGFDTPKKAWDAYEKYLLERQEVLMNRITQTSNELQQVNIQLNKLNK